MHKVEAKRRSALACELPVVLRNAISPREPATSQARFRTPPSSRRFRLADQLLEEVR